MAPADPESLKAEELSTLIREIRARVRARYSQPFEGSVQLPLPDLMPLLRARDAAEAKVAAIGTVNPRAGGVLNSAIQLMKRAVARILDWHVREQVEFNRHVVSSVQATLDALTESNRLLSQVVSLREEADQLKDMRTHWSEWRQEWDRKLAVNEINSLKSIADLQGAFQHRTTLMESNFREIAKSQHTRFTTALERSTLEIQQRLWADLERIRAEFERLIHTELRLIRQRASAAVPEAPLPQTAPAPSTQPNPAASFDQGRFAERFRGSPESVREKQEFYIPFFAGRRNVLDIGCGRGEFLSLLREQQVPARGIDLNEECVAICRTKGLEAEATDVFWYLENLPEESLDGIFSAQVVEHLSPERIPELIRLAGSRLQKAGILVIETPNPECLAIFATHFYLDPTHTRPVPYPLLAFYMEEYGLGQIEVHPRSPALESMPVLKELPEEFRKAFFGGLDYAIIGRKLL